MPKVDGEEVETGCYVDGHWGQYGGAKVIMIAVDFGWLDGTAEALASKHLAAMQPSINEDISPDQFEVLDGAVDDAEDYLNSVTEDGFRWGWNDGEFFLWPDEMVEAIDAEGYL